MCTRIATPKGNMGYDQYTVSDTVAVEPSFVAFFPLALANVRPCFNYIKLGYLTHSFEIVALSVVRTLFYMLLNNAHMK